MQPTPQLAPNLDGLLSRYLARQAVDAASESEVEPHEVAGGFRPAPADLWRESQVACPSSAGAMPPEWAAFCDLELPPGLVAFGAGVFPQRLRGLDSLKLNAPAAAPATAGFGKLKAWATAAVCGESLSKALAAAGVLASLGDAATAEKALVGRVTQGGVEGADALNQVGVCHWLAGNAAGAEAAWAEAHALDGSNPRVLWNLAVAELGRVPTPEIAARFGELAGRLSDASGWSHLARLYSTLAG